ncbi:MAG: hypothetical protein JJE30_11370 [Desulfuromonadales bacterium]|nr:hypothetical protein [Desulfuromonadales bacterium]
MSEETTRNIIIDALVVFVDARGFTSWSENTDVFAFIDEFGIRFQELLTNTFSSWSIKHLGDGAMLVLEIKEKTTEKLLKRLLLDTIKNIQDTEKQFKSLCKELSVQYGSRIPLRLGWGITKGHIKRAGEDFIGSDINKSSRLCSIARPYGVVIDKDDFPVLPNFPKTVDISLYEQIRKLNGIPHDIHVWVTKEIATQFITREHLREAPEVHVAGLCIKKENNLIYCLISKRSPSRQLFPNLYEGCGGQLTRNELFTTGVKRHYQLELNLEVEVQEAIHKFYYIQQPNEPTIPGLSFLCLYKSGKEHSENHTEVKWVTEAELKSMPEELFIKGLKDEFLELLSVYKQTC